jgi:rsbT co-antagonist protein RsbR
MTDPPAQADLLRELEHLRSEVRVRDQLLAAFEETTTPVIQVWKGVLAVPLIGTIDAARASRIMESLLNGIVRYQAEIVILDITGVPVVDTAVAHHLIKTVKAASLLGAQCVLVGIGRETAISIVHLGVDLGAVITRGNLQAGIEYALSELGYQVVTLQTKEGNP